jgi:hypothetical protein
VTVDPRLMSITPNEPKRVVPHGLNVVELEVPALGVDDRAVVTLAACARTVATKELVWIDALVSIGPIDLHDTSTVWSAKLDGLRRSARQGSLPSHRPEAAAVRSRTVTVA